MGTTANVRVVAARLKRLQNFIYGPVGGKITHVITQVLVFNCSTRTYHVWN